MSRDAETIAPLPWRLPQQQFLAWGNNPLESMGETYQASLFLLLFWITSFFVSVALPCYFFFFLGVCIRIPSLSLPLFFGLGLTPRHPTWVCFGTFALPQHSCHDRHGLYAFAANISALAGNYFPRDSWLLKTYGTWSLGKFALCPSSSVVNPFADQDLVNKHWHIIDTCLSLVLRLHTSHPESPANPTSIWLRDLVNGHSPKWAPWPRGAIRLAGIKLPRYCQRDALHVVKHANNLADATRRIACIWCLVSE